jgi:hypothetical protein
VESVVLTSVHSSDPDWTFLEPFFGGYAANRRIEVLIFPGKKLKAAAGGISMPGFEENNLIVFILAPKNIRMGTFTTIMAFITTIIIIRKVLAYLPPIRLQKGRSPKSLKPLEKRLFEQLARQLSGPVGEIVSKQMTVLQRGERLRFSKSYLLHIVAEKKNALPDDLLFTRRDEFKLATIWFTVAETKYKAEFTAYAGRIWDLKIWPKPSGALRRAITSIDRFKVNNDPMEELDLEVKVEFYQQEETLNGLLGNLEKQYTLTEVRKAIPDPQRKLFVKLSETKFPADFLELYEQTNGFVIDGVQVEGFGSMWTVDLEDGSYWVIAEKEGGTLSIRKSSRKAQLKYHSTEDESDIRPLGSEFLSALDIFMNIE